MRLSTTTTADFALVRAVGPLSARTAPGVRAGLLNVLRKRQRVIADVSGIDLRAASAVLLLPPVLAAAGGWPWARLVVMGASRAFEAAMVSHRADLFVPLAATIVDARRRLAERPREVATSRSFEGVSAAKQTRQFVHEVCEVWRVPEEPTEQAVYVANELVSNAIEHAGSGTDVTLDLGPDGLMVSVSDASVTRPQRLPPDPVAARGRGIAMVERIAADWGVLPAAAGKTVWALVLVGGDPAR